MRLFLCLDIFKDNFRDSKHIFYCLQHQAPTYGFPNEIPTEMQLSFLSDVIIFAIDQPYTKMIVLLVILDRVLKSPISISASYKEKGEVCNHILYKPPFLL